MNQLKNARYILVAALTLFLIIAFAVSSGYTLGFDTTVIAAVEHLRTPALTAILLVLTTTGGPVGVGVITTLLSILLLRKRGYHQLVFVLGSVLGALALFPVLKLFFERSRPSIVPHLVVEQAHSFPSGHALMSAVLAITVCVILYHTRWRRWAIGASIVCIVVVGFTRLYLGVHYPSDLVAGWCLAVVCASVVYIVTYRKWKQTQ